ncbi:GTP-binding protein [Candidatus Omnitrophota bacterium]
MQDKEISIVIVGHVDHGKSTLIGRLLFDTHSLSPDKMEEVKRVSKELGKDFEFAFVVDQLKEEREGELTIDTTQAFFKTQKRRYVIIDAPGHTEFIKNMVTGATQAEAAVLIVSAEKGVEEQTKRHAYILSMLGMSQVIIVINKMDLVNYDPARFTAIKDDMEGFLSRIGISASCFIPISARLGGGIAKPDKNAQWYKGPALVQALDSVDPRKKASKRPLRFPVQDIYQIDGQKLVVGKVASGVISQGQGATLLPCNEDISIDSIKVFQEKRSKAKEGENIGIVIDPAKDVKRGDVICQKGDAPELSSRFRGNVFWMAEKPLRVKDSIVLRCATQETECMVSGIEKRLNSSTLEEIEKDPGMLGTNEVGVVLFETAAPVAIERFNVVEELGRFVLESGGSLLGSGTINQTRI